MTDPRFYRSAGPFAVGALARLIAAELSDAAAASVEIMALATPEQAGPADLAPITERSYLPQAIASRAGAFLTSPALAPVLAASLAPLGRPMLIVAQPRLAQRALALLFYPEAQPAQSMIDPSASVAPDAQLGEGCQIAARAVIGANACLGRACQIGAGAVIGDGVVLGEGCIIGANASISHARLGDRVEIYPGARIGAAGFSFLPSPQGMVRLPQLGRVVIGHDVEVGANSTIDRGTLGDTVIGDGCRLDNLVHIGHNSRLGRGCVLAAQTGLGGSVVLGDGVVLGGQVGLKDHLIFGDGARVASGSGVIRDVGPGETVAGYPAVPVRQWHRQTVSIARLTRKGREPVEE